MITGVVDSTVVIHILRKNMVAAAWLAAQPEQLAITPVAWMEVIYGASGKRGQVTARALLGQFELVYLTVADVDWAMQQLLTYRLSHGSTIMDCLIASVCHRLQVPLYTHNLRDMRVLLGATLPVQPY
jgi:predicted nucleic acid-binding protein